jgi:hypothetical protein
MCLKYFFLTAKRFSRLQIMLPKESWKYIASQNANLGAQQRAKWKSFLEISGAWAPGLNMQKLSTNLLRRQKVRICIFPLCSLRRKPASV